MTKIIGCDPGRIGGFVIIDDSYQIIDFLPTPSIGREINIKEIVDWLEGQKKIDHVFIEHSQALHKAAAGVTFSFGKNFGILLGVIGSLRLPYTLVKPKVWQKVMFEGTDPGDKPKSRAYAAALRHYPTFEFVPKGRRNPHDGLVDASLVAGYGMYKMRGSLKNVA